MSLKLVSRDEKIKVVSRFDDAVTCNSEEYNEYLKSLDEGVLKLNGEPTRFEMRLVIQSRDVSKIDEMKMRMVGGEMSPNLAYILEEVRCSLVGIENPKTAEEPIEFKQDGSGGASKELMERLHAANVYMDLFTARQNALTKPSDILKKK